MTTALQMYIGTVVSTEDPQGLGRVQLSVNGSGKGVPVQQLGWAKVAMTPLSPTFQVRPSFSAGDSVIFAVEKPPLEGAVVLSLVGGRAVGDQGTAVTFPLGEGQQATLKAGAGGLQVSTSSGQLVSLQADGSITVAAATKVTVSATEVHVTAAAVIADAAMTKFSGVVQCDTLIASTVSASTYTPGAGNTW